jgi:PD-(D/E)XK nuclease superfamily
VNNLSLPTIPATNPTLAETMRACLLRAGLSRAAGSSRFVLGNPKAWLGTAYHEVLEKIIEINLGHETADAAVERLWTKSIAHQQRRADAHGLDRRFGSPTTWPGYHVARASVVLRAQEFFAGVPPTGVPGGQQALNAGRDGSVREQEFTGYGGKLLGRPDMIRAREVVDYKSGAIFEYDEATQKDLVKAAYVRQLRIYGYLVKEKLGWWPLRGLLLPLAGAGVEVALDPSDCAREAAEAVALLDSYNAKVLGGGSPNELASPSPVVCKWCPFKLLCPPFWNAVGPAWSGQLAGAAVEGVVDGPPRAIHNGAAVALSVDVRAGSETPRGSEIAPLNPSTHPSVTTVAIGDRLRIVGLRVRSDGSLVPTQRTVFARVRDLPDVALPTGGSI